MIKDCTTALLYILFASGLLFNAVNANSAVPECPPGKQILWYFPEEKLDEKTRKGFTRGLFSELTGPLSAIGYCLAPFEPHDTSIANASTSGECLIMGLSLCDVIDDNGAGEKDLFVALVKAREWNAAHGDPSVFRTLFSLRHSPNDLTTIQTIFIKKLVENLRTQYICTIAIATDPKGVQITARNGLSDPAPFEWVLPVGTLDIKCSMKKYLPLEKELVFSHPGQYSYFFQLRKRQFYHSGFVYPAVVSAIASGVALGAKYYYYDRYSRLDSIAMVNTPKAFAQTFRKVQICEGISLGSVFLSGVFLGLSFRF